MGKCWHGRECGYVILKQHRFEITPQQRRFEFIEAYTRNKSKEKQNWAEASAEDKGCGRRA